MGHLRYGNTWKALTDKQATLSISSLDIDPTDTKRLIAGQRLDSSSCLLNYCFIQAGYVTSGGNQNGLLYSKDEGKTWASLGGGSGPHLTQSGPLSNQTVVGVAARAPPCWRRLSKCRVLLKAARRADFISARTAAPLSSYREHREQTNSRQVR